MATASRKTNWFAIWTAIIAAVIVVGVVVSVIVANKLVNDPGTRPEGAGVNSSTGAVSFGDGEHVVDTYVDFECPICNQFEQLYGEQLNDLVEDGTITLNVHPVSILDRYSAGTKYSTRSASAYYCVAEQGTDKAKKFQDLLFENQQPENQPGLTDEQLIQYAKDAGADIADCQSAGTFERFVTVKTRDLPAGPDGGKGTPAIVIDGEYTELGTISQDEDYFTNLFKK